MCDIATDTVAVDNEMQLIGLPLCCNEHHLKSPIEEVWSIVLSSIKF